MKKCIMLLMAMSVVLWGNGVASAKEAVPLPPAGKLIVVGSDPEVTVVVKGNEAVVSFPYTKGQRDKMAGKQVSWQMNASVSHFRDGGWYLKSEEGDKYELKTLQRDNVVEATVKITADGCDWFRFWGKSGPDWLWITQSSQYYRLSESGKPGYEMVICSDERVHTIPADYPKRP